MDLALFFELLAYSFISAVIIFIINNKLFYRAFESRKTLNELKDAAEFESRVVGILANTGCVKGETKYKCPRRGCLWCRLKRARMKAEREME